jgi:hypothetical protein
MVTKDYQKGVYEWVTLGISDETCGLLRVVWCERGLTVADVTFEGG